MFLSRTIKSLAVATALFSLSAQAGTTLHFKKQIVDTNSRTQLNRLSEVGNTNYQVIQFKKAISNQDRQNLLNSGVKILRYIPDDAYLVKTDVNVLRSIVGAQAVLPYAPEFKISPEFGVIDHLSGERFDQVLVTLFNGVDAQSLQGELPQNVSVVFAKGKYLGLAAQHKDVKAIAKVDGVEWIQPYPKFEFMNFKVSNEAIDYTARKTVNTLDGFESGTKIMNFEAAWNRGLTGSGELVGFADTGLDNGDISSIHTDFQGQVAKGYPYGLISFSWDDPMGHGTHVAGSIAGNGNASQGILKGGAYNAQLVAGGMWSKLLNNMIPPQDITKMFVDAYNDGARIHTNSWGSPQNLGAYDQFAQTVDEYMWNNPEMLIMFAAGNSGTDANNDGRVDEDSIGTPATAKNVLSVGASENLVSEGGIQRPIGDLKQQDGTPLFSAEPIASDYLSNNENGIAAFSSRGPTDDRRMKPDVVAPGANILSVRSQVEGASELWGAMNQDYTWSGGTSMSTPLVAGGAAVVREYLANLGSSNPSAALVKAILMHTAFDMYPGQFGQSGKATGQEMLATRPNPHQGFGRVDMDFATSLDNTYMVEGRVTNGAVQTVSLPSGSNYMITLVYTDAPGAASASRALVNNLDIDVVEDGTVIASGTDSINNSEYIEVAGVSGRVEINVKGQVNTPDNSGGQPFAMVVTVQ